ncbi:MAG: ATP-binding protein [Candidatus Omnitrophica bacterium]|nr:ATP-binding protein [Candidatus Omnitrophota bacterium]
MKIRAKLTILLLVYVGVFVTLLVLYSKMEHRRLDMIFRAEATERINSFRNMLQVMEASLEAYAYDYTYWHEMVSFILTGSQVWAKNNIDPSLQTYKANAAWVYNEEGLLVYSTSNIADKSFTSLPVPPGMIERLFAKSRFCHFFIMTPLGPMEIRGATVHSSSDRERRSSPAGYFFVGRMWDRGYLSNLSRLTATEIKMCEQPSGKPALDLNLRKGTIIFHKTLNDWRGNPLACLEVQSRSNIAAILLSASRQTLLVLLFYAVVLFMILSVALVVWVNVPLDAISQALATEDVTPIKVLTKTSGEFGNIAALICKFFEQRRELMLEINERRRAEEALGMSEYKFSKTFHANPSPMAVFSRYDGHILDVNSSFLSTFGYSREEVIGYSLIKLNIVPTPIRVAVKKMLRSQDTIHNMELEVSTRTGHKRTFLFSAEKIDAGEDKLLLAVANDITERKQAEESLRNKIKELEETYKKLQDTQTKLVQSEKMAALGRFASGVAHEVKNPLAVILGGLEYISAKMPHLNPEVKEAMVKMREAIMRADITVKDLLTFAKPSKLVTEIIHPNLLVNDTISFAELFKHKSDTANITIRRELTSSDIYVAVDRNQMQQALFNILLNAIEALSMSGEIVVKTYPSEGILPLFSQNVISVCVIEISDNGPGISKDDIAKLFEPFFTTKRDQKGTGLGLAIVKSIVERHKGLIKVESELGKGTVVRIMLPVMPQYKGGASEKNTGN